MRLPPTLVALLDALASPYPGGADPTSLDRELALLLDAALTAVPSCTGLSITVATDSAPLTIAVGSDAGSRVTLSITVPGGGGTAPAVVTLAADRDDALDALAADVRALWEIGPARVALSRHPPRSTLGGAAADVAAASDVDRAVGVLLDRGLRPADGLAELRRLADDAGTDLPAAARTLLAGLGSVPTPSGHAADDGDG